jgi:phage portal protein BeeE
VNPFELLRKAQPVKTPIPGHLVAEATGQSVRTNVVGNDPGNFMSPAQPLEPQQQQIAGRQYDFQVGGNLQYTPRGTEPVTFQQLRALADGYDLLRILIETRKDQLVKFKWQIEEIDDKKSNADSVKRCQEVQNFLKFPDRRHNWQQWLRGLVEDMLVTDAACIYPVRTRGGDMYALEWMDGSTLKVVIDENGRQPMPPEVAYQQIIKGIPAVDYSMDDVLYLPRNVRVNRLYGYPPVEQIIMTVNIALRRQISQLQAYTEGNIPEAIISVPATWNVDQIAKYQAYWDSLLEGNTGMRRHAKFVAGGTVYIPTKEALLKDAFDEWLARVCCFCFSIPPSAFVKDQNRATSESAKEAAIEEGLVPLMQWIKDMIDLILWKHFGYQDLEFLWQDEEPTDPLEIAQVNEIYVRNGIKSVDDIREDLGMDPIGMPAAIYTGSGAILIKNLLEQKPDTAIVSTAGAVSTSGKEGEDGKPAGAGTAAAVGDADHVPGQPKAKEAEPVGEATPH